MRPRKKTAIAVGACLIWALSVVVAFEVGGRLGHTIGSAETTSWETVSHGMDAYHTLIQLPEGSSVELRQSLERSIDYALINYLSLAEWEPSRFDLYPLPVDPCGRLPSLAAHRAANPSPSEDPYRLKLIEEAVRRLSLANSVASGRPKCGTPSAA